MKNKIRRVHGIQKSCTVGTNEFIYVIDESIANVLGVEILGQSQICAVDMFILDKDDNVIGQFGFSVQTGKDVYSHLVKKGTEVIKGMKIKCIVISTVAESIGVNFILNEIVFENTGIEPDEPAVIP